MKFNKVLIYNFDTFVFVKSLWAILEAVLEPSTPSIFLNPKFLKRIKLLLKSTT